MASLVAELWIFSLAGLLLGKEEIFLPLCPGIWRRFFQQSLSKKKKRQGVKHKSSCSDPRNSILNEVSRIYFHDEVVWSGVILQVRIGHRCVQACFRLYNQLDAELTRSQTSSLSLLFSFLWNVNAGYIQLTRVSINTCLPYGLTARGQAVCLTNLAWFFLTQAINIQFLS